MKNTPLDRFFHPVLESSRLHGKPFRVVVGEEKVAVYRESSGAVRAVEDRCPHRFTPLSLGSVKNDEIVCPYHGWRVNNSGAVEHPIDGPVKNCKVKTYAAYEMHGLVWIAANEHAHRPALSEKPWFHVGAYRLEINAPLHLVLDNFNEDEHFPYVHKVLGWNEVGARDVQFDFKRNDDDLNVHYRGPQRSFPGMRIFGTKPGMYFDNNWVVTFNPVQITYTATPMDRAGNQVGPLKQRVSIFFVPSGTAKTVLNVIQYTEAPSERWHWLLSLLRPLTLGITKWDLCFDKRLVEKMTDIPYSHSGMRLGKYDQPLFHSRKMLDQKYFGKQETSAQVEMPTSTDELPASAINPQSPSNQVQSYS